MIVDASARAHALSAAYEQSPSVKRIIVTPGNDFMGYHRRKEVIIAPGTLTDSQSFLGVAKKYKPDLVDVCQDDALACGTVDLLQKHGFAVFGPTRKASRLEWDKAWSRELMENYRIPHPNYNVFSNNEEGMDYVFRAFGNDPSSTFFVKAAGLCAGKGAIKADNLEKAIAAIKEMKNFGTAGETFLVEKAMVGEEASVYAICDGNSMYITKPAQDHKQRDVFDSGPNTGGMGAVAPCLLVSNDKTLQEEIRKKVLNPAMDGLEREGIPYTGILYGGIMAVDRGGDDDKGGDYRGQKTPHKTPMVIEFNARWGAPEAEVVIPGILTPMDEISLSCIAGKLVQIHEDPKTRVCIVGASRGYPGDYSSMKGKQIFGLERVMEMKGVSLFGAGIVVSDGKFYASGGRLFSVVAEGDNVSQARQRALSAMAEIHIQGNNLHYRTDIGWRDVERMNNVVEGTQFPYWVS